MLTDSYARGQVSEKGSAHRFDPFAIKGFIGNNALKFDFPAHFKISPVVDVIHNTLYVAQPSDIALPILVEAEPIPRIEGDDYEVEKILAHRREGSGYQFLTLIKGSSTHDAKWHPTKEFVDRDGTRTKLQLKYIRENNTLPQYH